MMQHVYCKCIIICFFAALSLVNIKCRNEISSTYKFIPPKYGVVEVSTTRDTIRFRLDTFAYTDIKSFNYFIDNGLEYISFYDRRSQSISIYEFKPERLVKRILLKESFRNRLLYKTTVFVKNFDSLFIANYVSIYRMDTSGVLKDSMVYQTDPYLALSSFDNKNPPVFKDGILYAEARPRLSNLKFRNLKRWKVLYSFDFDEGRNDLHYYLPKTYQENIYSYAFFYPSYCCNDKGRFVFSFPADTNIYETDLENYHIAYYGKSRFQKEDIRHVENIEDLDKEGETARMAMLNDFYYAIYFDPCHKRYLRVMKQRISEQDFNVRNWKRKQTIIVFDEHFRIIGESPIDGEISSGYVFFTKDGNIYARTKMEEEGTLCFVRLAYSDQMYSLDQRRK